MALYPSFKTEIGSDVGIQRLLGKFYQYSFQLTNKFWCVIVPPDKLMDKLHAETEGKFSYDYFMDIFNIYIKSTNMPYLNNKIESANYSGNILDYVVGHNPKEPISVSCFADRMNIAKYVLESWKSLSASKYPTRISYKKEITGRLIVYSLAGLDHIVDINTKTDDEKIKSAVKEAGKYLVRRTGAYQFADNSPLKYPNEKIKLDISNIRVYNNVQPYEIGNVVKDKADDAIIEILPVNFSWDNYIDFDSMILDYKDYFYFGDVGEEQ